jgi:HK97 gp10 family phage protein
MARETFQIIGLEGVLKTLQELPPELVSKNGGPVRAALRKAALLIQKQAQANVQRIIDEPNASGLPPESTGLLKANVVVQRGKAPRSGKGERYLIRVRRKRYPGSKDWKERSTSQIGALLEYGTGQRRPSPWMRPAFEQRKQEALAVFQRELPAAIDRAVKKLARQNGVA